LTDIAVNESGHHAAGPLDRMTVQPPRLHAKWARTSYRDQRHREGVRAAWCRAWRPSSRCGGMAPGRAPPTVCPALHNGVVHPRFTARRVGQHPSDPSACGARQVHQERVDLLPQTVRDSHEEPRGDRPRLGLTCVRLGAASNTPSAGLSYSIRSAPCPGWRLWAWVT